ncbi:MAG: hypothetical protein VB858_16480 [Planctomycetaceae bacterium]
MCEFFQLLTRRVFWRPRQQPVNWNTFSAAYALDILTVIWSVTGGHGTFVYFNISSSRNLSRSTVQMLHSTFSA